MWSFGQLHIFFSLLTVATGTQATSNTSFQFDSVFSKNCSQEKKCQIVKHTIYKKIPLVKLTF